MKYDRILKQFPPQPQKARKLLDQFVRDGFGAGHREEFYAVKAQRDLADDECLARVAREFNKEPSRPPTDRSRQIEAAVCRQCELPVDLLKSRSEERRGSFGRGLAACLGAGAGRHRA